MKAKAYLHSSREQMYELGESLGLKDEALKMFSYGLCEVEIDLDVDDQGGVSIDAVNGRKVLRED